MISLKTTPRTRVTRLFGLAATLLTLCAAAADDCPPDIPEGARVVGRVERVRIGEAGLVMKARIDTGAGVSSINASKIEAFEDKKGHKKVRFVLTAEDGREVVVSRPLVGWARVKLKKAKADENTSAAYTERPIVKLDLCLGGKTIEGRVNLADRSHMLYPLLIGRNTLTTGGYLVNTREKFTQAPSCP